MVDSVFQRDMPTVQCGTIRGVDGMQQIPDREHTRGGGAQARIDERTTGAGVDLDTSKSGQFVVGDQSPVVTTVSQSIEDR